MKPCPFCGSIQLHVTDEDPRFSRFDDYRVYCENCEAVGPAGKWSLDAKQKWDERLPDDDSTR